MEMKGENHQLIILKVSNLKFFYFCQALVQSSDQNAMLSIKLAGIFRFKWKLFTRQKDKQTDRQIDTDQQSERQEQRQAYKLTDRPV